MQGDAIKPIPSVLGIGFPSAKNQVLMFRFVASKFAGRFRHLAGNGISHVSIVNPFPKFVYINRFHFHASYSSQNVTTEPALHAVSQIRSSHAKSVGRNELFLWPPPSRLLLRIAYISQGWITAPLGRAGFGGLHPRTVHCFPRFSTEGQYSLYRETAPAASKTCGSPIWIGFIPIDCSSFPI